MDHRVITALLEAIIPEVKDHSANLVAPIKDEIEKLVGRLGELEVRQPERGEKGEPGTPTIEQITEAIGALHVEAIVRDAQEDPWASKTPAPAPSTPTPANDDDETDDEKIAAMKNIARWGAKSMLTART